MKIFWKMLALLRAYKTGLISFNLTKFYARMILEEKIDKDWFELSNDDLTRIERG